MKTVKKNTPVTSTNAFVQAMQVQSNYTTTEKGALTNKSTLNYVLDWFAVGGALRQRSPEDVINLFSRAYAQDKLLTMKILFYFRDCTQGQGERISSEILAASASLRRERRRTCSHQNGRKKRKYAELTERAASRAGRADAVRATEAATAAR